MRGLKLNGGKGVRDVYEIDYQEEVQAYDSWLDHARYEYKFSFLPRRCYKTKRFVWGTAVRGRAVWTGPGDPAVEDRWFHRNEALIMLIKGVAL